MTESLILLFKTQGNYYTDACLVAAGGKASGKLDFYQIHTYTPFSVSAPFKVEQLGLMAFNKWVLIVSILIETVTGCGFSLRFE